MTEKAKFIIQLREKAKLGLLDHITLLSNPPHEDDEDSVYEEELYGELNRLYAASDEEDVEVLGKYSPCICGTCVTEKDI